MKSAGFSLGEMTLGLAVISCLLAAACLCGHKFYGRAQVEAALNSLAAVCNASQHYYSRNQVWPDNVAQLSGDYLNGIHFVNPFGQEYMISKNSNRVDVSTLIPKGAISQSLAGPQAVIKNEGAYDRVTFSSPAGNGVASRLFYDKKYLYKE
ncbi:MAG: hypothetical protein HQL23_05935 [Candidatus Omnitrophica bacterium]|nr:hypothetical protein [Candidatus Omnitrophota bacterium]